MPNPFSYNILVTLDRNYLPVLRVMLHSLSQSDPEGEFTVYAVHNSLTEQDLLALFERHGYDLVLLEGFQNSGWPKIEVVRSAVSAAPESIQPLAVGGDIPGANFGLEDTQAMNEIRRRELEDTQALVDWLVAQMPTL